MSPRVGVTLSGRYRLQRLIATGGMGQVWEAVDSRLGRRVAVKVLKAEYSSDPEFVERFRAEARTVAMLNHPGIASVYDYGETELDDTGRTEYLPTRRSRSLWPVLLCIWEWERTWVATHTGPLPAMPHDGGLAAPIPPLPRARHQTPRRAGRTGLRPTQGRAA